MIPLVRLQLLHSSLHLAILVQQLSVGAPTDSSATTTSCGRIHACVCNTCTVSSGRPEVAGRRG